MWLTPCRSRTSSVRSAVSWVTRPRAAAPKMVRVLTCPVRPKVSVGIMLDLHLRAGCAADGARTLSHRVARTTSPPAGRRSTRPRPGAHARQVRGLLWPLPPVRLVALGLRHGGGAAVRAAGGAGAHPRPGGRQGAASPFRNRALAGAPHVGADGHPTPEILATRDDRLANWRTLQELAGLR